MRHAFQPDKPWKYENSTLKQISLPDVPADHVLVRVIGVSHRIGQCWTFLGRIEGKPNAVCGIAFHNVRFRVGVRLPERSDHILRHFSEPDPFQLKIRWSPTGGVWNEKAPRRLVLMPDRIPALGCTQATDLLSPFDIVPLVGTHGLRILHTILIDRYPLFADS